MNKTIKTILIAVVACLSTSLWANNFEKDTFKTSGGDLVITFIGHGTLMMEFQGKTIHVDPVKMYADYEKLPKADLILVTHAHGDHLDKTAIDVLKKDNTLIVLAPVCKSKFSDGIFLANGETGKFKSLKVSAVPAYNIKHMRSEGKPFHPKGEGNGYVIEFSDMSVYVAGDTENIPEMKDLKGIDIAFLPMNLPYTMTPEMVASASGSFKPKILYPYHFGGTDTQKLLDLMKNQKETEVRIRKLN